MSDRPGEKVGNFGPFASNETGERVAVPITQWSPTFIPEGGQAASLPGAEAIANPSPLSAQMGGGCSYTLLDLAALRPGSGSAPDARLQGPAQALEGSYREGTDLTHTQLGMSHERLEDFTGGPTSQPAGRSTPPG